MILKPTKAITENGNLCQGQLQKSGGDRGEGGGREGTVSDPRVVCRLSSEGDKAAKNFRRLEPLDFIKAAIIKGLGLFVGPGLSWLESDLTCASEILLFLLWHVVFRFFLF